MQVSSLGTGVDPSALLRSGRSDALGTKLDRLMAGSGPEAEKLRRLRGATQEFESLFVTMLMESMRKSVQKSGFLDGGRGEEVFQSLQDEQVSRGISQRGGLGIGDMLFRTLSRQWMRGADPAAAPAPDRGNLVDTAA